jgi:hypothetical protein
MGGGISFLFLASGRHYALPGAFYIYQNQQKKEGGDGAESKRPEKGRSIYDLQKE